MDRTLNRYKKIIKEEMELRASRRPANRPLVERHLIVDKDCNQFILLSVGRHGVEYLHYTLIHLQLKDGKVLIHEDRTDPGILEALMEKGIPEKDVLPVYLPDFEWAKQAMAA